MGVRDEYLRRFSPQALFEHNKDVYTPVETTPEGDQVFAGGADKVDAQKKAYQQQQAAAQQQAASPAAQQAATNPQVALANRVLQSPGVQKALNGQSEQAPVSNYTEMFKRLMPQQTPEQIEKENRRLRAKKNIAMVSDAISAIANLGSTFAGAPNSIDPKNSLSAVSHARWKELREEREKKAELYRQAMLRAAQLDMTREQQRQNAEDLREYREQQLEEQRRYHDLVDANNKARQQAINENNQANNAVKQQRADNDSKRTEAYVDNSKKKGSSGGGRSSGRSSNGQKTVVVENEYNTDGKVVKKTTTTTPGGGSRGRGSSSSSSNNSGKQRTRVQV